YINEYHGTYFHYGESTVKDAGGTVVEDTAYSEKYVVDNDITKLVTTGRDQVSLATHFRSVAMEGELNLLLTFDGNSCTVSAPEDSPFAVSGTGTFQSGAYSWGNKARNGIELNYTVSDGTFTYEASEVLVVRDRGVVMEVFTPSVSEGPAET